MHIKWIMGNWQHLLKIQMKHDKVGALMSIDTVKLLLKVNIVMFKIVKMQIKGF